MLKILIVDDSIIYRKIIEMAFDNIPLCKIIGSVRNGKKAIEFLEQGNIPDIITLDLEMPEMDGLETLKHIEEMKSNKNLKISTLMISATTQHGANITLEALDNGAFDFITKPNDSANQDKNLSFLTEQLISKIGVIKDLPKESIIMKRVNTPVIKKQKKHTGAYSAILIGISTGGPRALSQMLPELCEKIDLPIIIVQHMPENFTKSLAIQLDKKCSYKVQEAQHNDIITQNNIYIAPGGKHLVLNKSNSDVICKITDAPPENGCKPSVDIMFRSGISAFNGNVIATILTGMGKDGTKGALALKRSNAYIIAQDEKSSTVWGMPKQVYDTGCVDEVCALMDVPDAIKKEIK